MTWRDASNLCARMAMARQIRNVLPERDPPKIMEWRCGPARRACASCCFGVSLKLVVAGDEVNCADAAFNFARVFMRYAILPFAKGLTEKDRGSRIWGTLGTN